MFLRNVVCSVLRKWESYSYIIVICYKLFHGLEILRYSEYLCGLTGVNLRYLAKGIFIVCLGNAQIL